MASTEIVESPRVGAIVEQLRGEEIRRRIEDLLPANVGFERFTSALATALLNDEINTDKPQYRLVNADANSLFMAVAKCAKDGLLPDGRQAALTVKGGKVVYLPMVGGFRDVAAQYGWRITSAAVREHDRFEFSDQPPSLVHQRPRVGMERGELVAAYAVAIHTRTGDRVQCVMDRDQILKRAQSAVTDRIWAAWPDEMWAKTPVRDLFQDLPLDPDDKARVTRMLAAFDDPSLAAQAIYGPKGADALAAPQAAQGELVAGEAQEEPSESAKDGYNPAQDADDPIAAAKLAAAFVPTGGVHAAAERTLAEVHDLGDDHGGGARWFKKALSEPNLPEPFRQALLDFTRVYIPELHEQAVQADQVQL